MEQDWGRLGAALSAARKSLGVTQVAMAEKIGITRGPLQAIERGESKRLTNTIAAYARAVGWADGSAEAVLAGGDPAREPEALPASPTENAAPAYAKGMPQRVVMELTDGAVLDTDVIDLTSSGSSTPLVLVAKALPDDASDQDKREILLRWARIQRRVREIVNEELQ
jgi:transcriptional regulator with XRE-family HTH domain